ncbi:hypothetical protein BWQ96_08272 [Gracilariopsis chorda]|uniref:Non-canonical E2 ubiquitin-conjugating enzyme C-terminal domain-containing protein n=1 Tax=Gracilariopsis chorda TaxID=448386 RepID=A0A2V3IIX4_9FLOR|nr:hypothetical protein BWQ96_08272 [Gracilariopsis chorda]|eukprot:PXF42022.1 hypothetical protein BWQ96_08272 [Gracilariopsis chorda]
MARRNRSKTASRRSRHDSRPNQRSGPHSRRPRPRLQPAAYNSPAPRDDARDRDVNMDQYDDASDAPLDQPHNGHQSHPHRETERHAKVHSVAERAKYIPLRLSQTERKVLRLVEAALNVSEYTDVVDVLATSRMKTKQRIHTQIRDLCSILTGLAVATDYARGQKLVKDRDFADNEAFFQTAFEIARRHKVANPEKSRDTYGKLIHMLQDSVNDEITRLLEFSCVKPLVTVTSYLEDRGGLKLLEDPMIHKATMEIIPTGKSRRVVQREIQAKERAVTDLAKRYKNGRILDEEAVRRCLYSIGDNNAYLRAARDPCDTMIKYLHSYFKAERPATRENSLAITEGMGGARLTHDHVRQFRYVFQSLALWREVCHEMYKLWCLSEKDLLDSKNPYHLRNTGQGLNRIQAAPSVSEAMYDILNTVQRRVGKWVGSSVVHLGDYNVPNALTFIDKYAQVQRILGPLTTCIRRIGEIAAEDRTIDKYITETFGGVEVARKLILRDFFRHAFDGSGASDWFSAGSCIDGRLTSAWNWCSDVERKIYWPLFLLTGFTGFDGDF